MKVVKRNKKRVEFDKSKIKHAILGAMKDADDVDVNLANRIANDISKELEDSGVKTVKIEELQDKVEDKLMASKKKNVARTYIKYRYNRHLTRELKKRDDAIMDIINVNDESLYKENSNKDARLVSTMRDYISGSVCKDIASRFYYPKDIWQAHTDGLIHLHDADYSPLMPIHNCCLINLEDMFQNGTVISKTLIETPKSFRTACTLTTQIITQVASSQYGGCTVGLEAIAKFVDVSRKKIRKEMDGVVSPDKLDDVVENLVREEVKDGIQTIQYQLITMSTTNGQSPFVTIYMNINAAENEQHMSDLVLCIQEILKQRIAGIKNVDGVPVTVAFPKLLYVLDDNNDHEGSKYWWLTKLAAECSSKRLVPDYISAKKMREYKEGNVFGCMGCRSFLQPYKDDNGKYKFYGRFNQGVVTLNLADIALSSNRNMEEFNRIFNERLEMCHRALRVRHERLLGVKSDVAPILWQNGALARLKEGETIDKLLFNDYSSISLGYAGLFECIKYMTGEDQLGENGNKFGIEVMQKLNDACSKWKKEENIGYSVYGTPLENTTEKFAKCLQKRFGVIKDITDKSYLTNSYHIDVRKNVDAFTKLEVESSFQKLSLGGAISYVEVSDLSKNIDAMLEVLKFISNNIMYAEINTTTAYCQVCGSSDITMEDDLKFHCHHCGNDDFNKMNIALRVCGYISTNPFNDGRAEDIHSRVYHLDGDDQEDSVLEGEADE